MGSAFPTAAGGTFASPHRSGRLFGKYAISGRTYTTAGGVVIPTELQYYGGEMAHLYGECTNVAAVNEALAGSGYRAITLRYADGRQTAAAQIWASRFTETTIGAYNAMFIVVAAVPEGVPAQRTCLAAHPNGASSALVMFDGAFDEARALYENRARLFLVRLLDSTQVAIDVGRERMGTDKRPGTIDMTRDGSRLRLAIADQWNRGVLRANLTLARDPAALHVRHCGSGGDGRHPDANRARRDRALVSRGGADRPRTGGRLAVAK